MKFYFISPIDAKSPGLYETFPETFIAQGHSITDNIHEADCVFFDSHSGYLPYDWGIIDVVLEKKLPVAYFDAFDYHCDSSKHWFGFYDYRDLQPLLHQEWAKILNEARQKCKLIYFMRKMQTNADYGTNVYPFEYVQFPDHRYSLTSRHELFNRPFDACFIGAASPRRVAFIDSLQNDGRLKLDIQFTTERMDHTEWLERHRRAKFFITADGGGLSDERAYQLMPIAAMLRQKNNQKLVRPWESLNDSVVIGEQDGSVSEDDITMLHNICNDKYFLYSLYLTGNEVMTNDYSEETRAKYILNILKENGIQ